MRNLLVFVLSFVLPALAICDEPKPTGNWDHMTQEIHGDGNYTPQQKVIGSRKAERFRSNIRDLPALAEKTNTSMRAIIKIAVLNLNRYGYHAEAKQIQDGWKEHDGELQGILKRKLAGSRNIGDFKPLSTWLAIAYEIIEVSLGYQMCYMLRISDIETLNFAIPVVFDPCTYGETEFDLHFIHDAKYRGLAPVVAYWTTVITCSIATYGGGYFFICSPIGMLVELAVDKKIAPWLAPKLYSLACH